MTVARDSACARLTALSQAGSFAGWSSAGGGSGCDDQPRNREAPDDRRDEALSWRTGEETDADPLRELICFAAWRLVELEVGGMTGAAHGENSAERLARPNGYAWP